MALPGPSTPYPRPDQTNDEVDDEMSRKRPGDKPKKPVDAEKVAAKRERRERAKAIREAEQRKQRRNKVLVQVGVLAAVAVIAVGVVIGIKKASEPDFVAAPTGFADDGGITVGNPDAPVTVTLVEDFACPHCAALHQESKDLINGYANGDDVAVEFRPVAFLDRMSSDEYSSRALNAAVCVVQDDPKNWLAMHDSLLENQPAEGGAGLPDSRLTEMAVESGADEDAVSTCIDDNKNEGWVDYTSNEITNEADFQGTPGVYVNGDRVNPTAGAIQSAVQEAQAS